MRPIEILATRGPTENVEDYLARILSEISEASKETPAIFAAEAFILTNFDEEADIVTEIDVANPDLATLTKAFATLIFYIQKRGPDRAQ